MPCRRDDTVAIWSGPDEFGCERSRCDFRPRRMVVKNPSRPARIKISASQPGDAFFLIIEDSGPGIPEELREKS